MLNARFSDSLNFVRNQSIKRVWNAFLVLGSYYISKWSGKNFQWGFPISVSVEPTTSCNLRCPECPSGLRSFTRPTGMLQSDTFDKVLNDLKSYLSYMIFYFQGEPYLNRELLTWVKKAKAAKIYTATSTNGHYLTDEVAKATVESGLDRLIISIDGTSQEVYTQYRKGGNLDKVISGAENVVKWKKALKSSTPHIIFQFLVVKPNEHQIPEVFELAKRIGVDEVKLKTAQVYDYENGNDLIPTNRKYSRYYQKGDGKWSLIHKLENSCWKLWHSCVFTWDGKVLPCCFDKDGQYTMGNVMQDPFKTIWKNQEYNAFRASVLKSRSKIEMCSNCTEGAKVWA